MPKPKTSKPSIPDPSGVNYRLAGFTIIVIFSVIGLIWMWIQLPTKITPIKPIETKPPVTQPATSTPVVIPTPTPQPIDNNTPIRPRPVGMTCDATNSICVDATFAAQTLTSPYVATGTAVAFEQQFAWRLEDANGEFLEEGNTMTHAPDAGIPGPFEIRGFILSVPKTATGALVLFEPSAKDGTPIHTVKIPVQLPTTSMKTKFFMPSGSTTDCSAVVPIDLDVARSGLPVETALRALLSVGPTMSSLRSAIPAYTRLISLKVSGGTATVVLSSELQNYGGGSCNVEAIRSQIEFTLKQFPSVKNVVISQEGKTPATTLQP